MKGLIKTTYLHRMTAGKLSEWQRESKDPFKNCRRPWNHMKKLQGAFSSLFFVDGRFQNFPRSSRKPLRQALEIEIQQCGSLMLLSLGELTPKQRVVEQCITVKVTDLFEAGWMNWRQPQPWLAWKTTSFAGWKVGPAGLSLHFWKHGPSAPVATWRVAE